MCSTSMWAVDFGLKSQTTHIFPPNFIFSCPHFCVLQTLNKMSVEIRLEKKNLYAKSWTIVRLAPPVEPGAIGRIGYLHLFKCPGGNTKRC